MHGFFRSSRAIASRCFSPPTEPVAPLADDRVVPVGECGDRVVDTRRLRRGHQLLVGGVGVGVAQVVADRLVEQVRVLRHHTDRGAQGVERQIAHVVAVDAHRAGRHVVQPGEQ